MRPIARQDGQAVLLLVAAMAAVLVGAVVLLVADQCSFITGAILSANGGMDM